MTDVDLPMASNLTPLLEQLSKALMELESHKNDATETVSFAEISQHFRDLEAKMLTRYAELAARETAFKQEQSETRTLLVEKESAVAAKEQDMFDRIQILKDAAVAAIAETRANHLPPPVHTEITQSSDVTFLQELTQFCEQMDAKGLVSFVIKNRKNISVICEELSHALKSSTEPGRLILDSLDGFYPADVDNNNNNNNNHDNNKDRGEIHDMRQSCVDLMEAMNAMLAKADMDTDQILKPEIKQQAKAIADEWRPKLSHHGDGKSVETDAFLQLLATFKISSEFDEDEVCKLVIAVSERRHAPQLCQSLGLAHKMPGVIEELISNGKLISAVHFIHTFKLVEKFPTVPLLKTYLKDLRRDAQGKRINSPNSESVLNEGNEKELAALRAVIYCVQKYDLEAEYPLHPLHRRLGQLKKTKTDRKRYRESTINSSRDRKPRSNGGGGGGYGRRSGAATYLPVNGHQAPAPAPAPPVYMDRVPPSYATPSSERYAPPHVDPYNYDVQPPPPGQTTYSQQVYEQGAYYYTPDDRAAAAAAVPPPAYGGYPGGPPTSYQPYM